MNNKKYEVFNVPKNEIIDTGPSEIVEKFLDVSEIENEKQHSLVRIDINVIEYPLFTKNPRRKKNQIIRYFFNRDKEAYIQVNPTSGDYIPGEFEERVFIAILKIMRDKKYNNKFYTRPSEILYNMGIPQTSYKSFYKKITLALQRLSQTSYTFKNSLYSNKMKGIIDDKINTNIMNIRIITLNQAKENEKEYFQDKRTKEVIEISISEHFYDNIIRKGYLVYDSKLLLDMDSPITRALYMLINKLRFNKFYLRVLALSLIKKIPLSDDAKSLGRSIKSLEKSCEQLKKMELISDYKVIKQGKLIQTEIEFFFEEKHNAVKQSFFYDDKNHFDNLLITYTDKGEGENEIVTESEKALREIQKEKENITPTEDKINEIFDILPPRARELKTMKGTIKDSIRQYGFKYVKYTAEYMAKNKVTKIRSYMIQALEKGWAESFMLNEKEKAKPEKRKEQQLTLNTMEMQNINSKEQDEIISIKNKLYEDYQKLDKEVQEEIDKNVYDEYVKNCGGIVGTPQKRAFKYAKESLTKDYLYKTNAEKEKNNFKQSDKDMKEIHMGTLFFGDSFNKENNDNNKNEEIVTTVKDIYKDIEDITFAEEKEKDIDDKKVKKSDIICDIRKVYNEISLFQMELLDFLGLLDTLEEGVQDKILRIVGISKYFEATVNGYYMKIEYVKDKESSIKIIKK